MSATKSETNEAPLPVAYQEIKARQVRGVRSDFSRLIGERIRTRRTELGWRQERLAAEFGVGRDSISRYEIGQTEINVSDLPHFAKVLKVPVAYFFGSAAVSRFMQNEGVSFDGPAAKAPVVDEEKLLREARLLRHFTMLPEDFQESVILHARALESLNFKSEVVRIYRVTDDLSAGGTEES